MPVQEAKDRAQLQNNCVVPLRLTSPRFTSNCPFSIEVSVATHMTSQLTSPRFTSHHSISPHITPSHLTTPCLKSHHPFHLTSPRFTSFHPVSPRFTPLHLISPHLTSPRSNLRTAGILFHSSRDCKSEALGCSRATDVGQHRLKRPLG